ncbi:MAG: 2-phospho-L-lactate transferase [Gammaproteobacteria bacterium]|nr:2-phospho-L-lactate transferase [Gammaproteobacteria bacterium]MCP5198515.1 2-phospho-L-lactate transferase [Gammaproteobacteria bacterium]
MSRYLAITGGVGGAKLALGLTHLLPADELAFVVNTGDDFEHLGLHVSPDLDTLMYTLSGLSNPDTGWGRVHESWNFIDTLRTLGGEDWFNLGDRDLAVHVLRTAMLRAGQPLDAVTRHLYTTLGVAHAAWPMSNDRVATEVVTADGRLAFQHYFVRERCAPRVTHIEFAGAADARVQPEVLAWLGAADLAGVVICPSNPFLSVDPLLALPALRSALAACHAPVVAVSPIVGGEAIKGPTAKIMAELGLPLDAGAVAAHYAGLIDGFIVDACDAALVERIAHADLAVIAAPSVMRTLDDRINLAHTALEFLGTF